MWTNPNPTSAFTAQDITLSSADYDFLLLVSNLYSTDATSISVIGAKGHGLYSEVEWFTQSAVHMRQRALTRISDTQFTFGEGLIDGTTDNASLIPVAIYGIKSSVTVDVSGIVANVSTDASKCVYDNTDSGLQATNVQDAIDELDGNMQWKAGNVSTGLNNFVALPANYKEILIYAKASTYNNAVFHLPYEVVSAMTDNTVFQISGHAQTLLALLINSGVFGISNSVESDGTDSGSSVVARLYYR